MEDNYDAIILYTDMYDSKDHILGPETKESLLALRYQTTIFDQIINEIKNNWTNHNTLIAFSPDHGVHASFEKPGRLGDHGTNSPLDLNILHYIGAIPRQQA